MSGHVLIHRTRLDGSLCNGKSLRDWRGHGDTVPCERCGHPVFLLDISWMCRAADIRERKVAVLVGGQWERHACETPETGFTVGEPCLDCAAAERRWLAEMLDKIGESLARADELFALADRHRAAADRLLAEATS